MYSKKTSICSSLLYLDNSVTARVYTSTYIRICSVCVAMCVCLPPSVDEISKVANVVLPATFLQTLTYLKAEC